MNYHSSPIVLRHPGNPILTAKDIPYPAELVFNAGVVKHGEGYLMAFRNDIGKLKTPGDRSTWQWEDTTIGIARSQDGIAWTPDPEPITLDFDRRMFNRAYDPRLSVVDGELLLCVALDSINGLCGGIATTDDLRHFRLVHITAPDNRNLAFFPDKFNGRYLLMERPLNVYSQGGKEHFGIWLAESPDLEYWGRHRLLLPCADVPFGQLKIGPGAPPVRTPRGYLVLFHAVHHTSEMTDSYSEWHKVYSIGAMLLDLERPDHIIGMGMAPLLYPEEPYELSGFRGSVLFPGAVIPEDDGTVKIYYGAADTVECLATARMDDLLDFCTPLK